jgi:hypothetical protein
VSTGDAETLVLNEDGAKPGTFSGSITTSSGAGAPDDGVLEVSDGASITASYLDADDGSGNPATITLDVKVDCAPPVISNAHVAALAGSSATIGVDSSEPASLTAEYGFSCDALSLNATSKLAPAPSVTLQDLYAGFTYYFALTATDAYGNSVRDDNGGACYSFKTLDLIFQQDFESGLGGFELGGGEETGEGGMGGADSVGGTGGIGGTGGTGLVAGTGGKGSGGRSAGNDTAGTVSAAGAAEAGAPGSGGTGASGGSGGTGGSGGALGAGLWHLSTSCASQVVGHSRPTTLAYENDASCTFDVGTTRGVATSPPITLSDATFATVEFNYFLGTEGGGFYDEASLEVSVNDGPFLVVTSNFTTLAVPDPDEPPLFRVRKGAQAAGRYALVENSDKWQHSVSDLTPFLGGLATATIRLRFHFDSLDPVANAFAGFLVDDVKVLGVTAPIACASDAECDDSLFCTGTERCAGGFCAKGQPVVCSGGDDGVSCTDYACDEATRGCAQIPNDDACDDGSFCNGQERCDATSGCQAGEPVACDDGDVSCVVGVCQEELKACAKLVDNEVCDDGSFCTGFEYCDPTLGCQSSGPPCVDGVGCTDDLCDEETFSCSFPPNDAYCNDGLFCNGEEYCDGYQGCRAPGSPCSASDNCDESGNQCIPICFTDTNQHHQSAGRAYGKRRSFFALGTNDALGKGGDTTSLQGSGEYWKRVPSCPAPPTLDSVSASVFGDTVTVSGEASDPNGDIQKVRLTFSVFLYFTTKIDATGTTDFAGSISLPPGVHSVTAQVVDQAGFVSAESDPIYFEILYPAGPTIDSISAAPSGSTVTVSGTASDPNNDITQIQLTIVKDDTVVASEVATGVTSFSGTVSGLAAGAYTARAQAFDSFGFASLLSSVPFEVTVACITATNASHKQSGRATLEKGTYFAVGSHDALGKKANATTSLSGSDGDWHKVDKCP